VADLTAKYEEQKKALEWDESACTDCPSECPAFEDEDTGDASASAAKFITAPLIVALVVQAYMLVA